MDKVYSALASHPLSAAADYARPTDALAQKVTLDSPAAQVMTDLTQVFVETVSPDAPIAQANRLMIQRGIRLLLVVDAGRQIVGLLTARDILGEKPLLHMQRRRVRREEILVADIMTPHDAVDVLDMADVARTRVGDIVATLKRVGRQHALVVEADGSGRQRVRGIFSASQIARQAGISIEPQLEDLANTFAQIEAALAKVASPMHW